MCGKEGPVHIIVTAAARIDAAREQVCVRLSRIIAIAIEYFCAMNSFLLLGGQVE